MRVLIITYWFLPSFIANAKRPFYFTEEFLKKGWSVDVVASYAGMVPSQQEMLSHPNLNIRRIEDPLDAVCRKLKEPFKTITFRCLKLALWPDLYVAWAVRIFFKVQLDKYDRVMVYLHPASLLLLSFSKKLSERWVFDCQEVFYPVYAGDRRSPILRILSPLLIKLQRHAFKKSDCVFFTSESARKEYIRRKLVDAGKTVHIPLFFDDKAFRNIPVTGSRFTIAYFGSFGCPNGVRSPAPFFQALKRFLDRNPEARSQTTFEFYGRGRVERELECIEHLGLQDVVKMNPPVSYERYLEVLAAASVLLLLVSIEHRFFIPSKMLDYFGVQRPILGLVPFDSEAYSMLKDANMSEYICKEQDVEGCADSIEKLWGMWEKQQPVCKNSKTTQWAASFQSARVIQILESGNFH